MAHRSFVGIAGDWHGNAPWACRVVRAMREAGVSRVYQVGDFGLWSGAHGRRYLETLHKVLDELDMVVYVVLGNHEDYTRVASMRSGQDGWLYMKGLSRIRYAPRAHTWIDTGCRFASLGGAGSIDRLARVEGDTWWPQEEILDSDVEELRALLRARDWTSTDVFLSHEAPAGVHRVGNIGRPSWITPEVEHYCWTQRVRLRDAVDSAAPAFLVHGHWHQWYDDALDGIRPDGSDYTAAVVGLNCDDNTKHALVVELQPGAGVISREVLL